MPNLYPMLFATIRKWPVTGPSIAITFMPIIGKCEPKESRIR